MTTSQGDRVLAPRPFRLSRAELAWASLAGALVGLLGGLIGLGGEEFRLPLLISLFGFIALQAVILNKAMSLAVVLTALPARLSKRPTGGARTALVDRGQPARRQHRRALGRRLLGHQDAHRHSSIPGSSTDLDAVADRLDEAATRQGADSVRTGSTRSSGAAPGQGL
jgi:hypothetical protein